MPTNRRYRAKQRRDVSYRGLTKDILQALKCGRAWFDQPTIEVLRQAWKEHGDDLLEQWVEENPGSRPFAWWLFEGVPQYGERPTTAYWRENHEVYREQHLMYGILHTHWWPQTQEPEHTFLHRHGVIDQAEYRAAHAAK